MAASPARGSGEIDPNGGALHASNAAAHLRAANYGRWQIKQVLFDLRLFGSRFTETQATIHRGFPSEA